MPISTWFVRWPRDGSAKWVPIFLYVRKNRIFNRVNCFWSLLLELISRIVEGRRGSCSRWLGGASWSTLLTGQRCLFVCLFVCVSVKKIWEKIPGLSVTQLSERILVCLSPNCQKGYWSVCHRSMRKDTWSVCHPWSVCCRFVWCKYIT
jgi:hypothetical protein